MHTRSVGRGVSADTDTIAETVTPWRPAPPSVVTTLTVEAAWLMPRRNRCRSAGSGRFTFASGGGFRGGGFGARSGCALAEPLMDRAVALGPGRRVLDALGQIRRLAHE